MRINQAATMLAVFWSLVILSSRGDKHTISNIRSCFGKEIEPSKRPDEDTISNALDHLERFGAVTFPYAYKSRRGRHDVAKLNPYKIPLTVRNKRPTRTTEYEWGKKLEEPNDLLNGQSIAIWKDGVRVLNTASFTDEMKAPLLRIVRWATPIAHFVFNKDSPKELDFDWIMSEIHGQPLKVDGKFLKTFYRYILLQFLFTYPHDWNTAPYISQLERTQEMFVRSVSFIYPHLYAEIALDRKAIILRRKGA
ncbi:MAG: hypothetical protein GC204_11240 [Chloroflexi bacterium]|nr:hypothetical protein [Chloroflexota bacterium]